MKCPFCGTLDNKVIDSRLSSAGEVTRRRRECDRCSRRYTTYERVEQVLPLVVKKDGRREPFDRMKILGGVRRACEKRPVSEESLERVVDGIERALVETGEKEVPSSMIGEKAMESLRGLDPVAYVRFASVYRSFTNLSEFMSEIARLMPDGESPEPSAVAPRSVDSRSGDSRSGDPREADAIPKSGS